MNSKNFQMHYKPENCVEIKFTGEAQNIPLLKDLYRGLDLVGLPHCEVRVCLFDMIRKVYMSNFYIMGA